jgi:hypothetical protein
MAVETTTLVRYYEATVTQQGVAREFQDKPGFGSAYKQYFGDDPIDPTPARPAAKLAAPLAATFVSFPWAPLGADEGWWSTPNAVARSLGMRPEHAPDYSQWPDAIPSVVARTLIDNMLAVEVPAEVGETDLMRLLESELARRDSELAAAERFLAEILDQPVIPLEESPLSGAALANLLSRAPEAAGAAVAVWGTGPDQTLLLLITMPTGMIVFGAASGVAKALNTGLRAKILGWMGVPDPLQVPAPANEPPANEPST